MHRLSVPWPVKDPVPSGSTFRELTVETDDAELALWQIEQLRAIAHYTDGSTRDVTALAAWTSPDDASIHVSDDASTRGRATGRSLGWSMVSASWGGKSVEAPFEVAEAGCHIVLNEVKTGTLLLTRDEFVELYNPCDHEVDVSAGRLVYRAVLGLLELPLCTMAGAAPMAPGEFRVFGGTEFLGLTDGTLAADLASLGGSLALRDAPSTAVVDSLGYGTALGELVEGVVALVIPSGKSLSRMPNGTDTDDNRADFVVSPPTPGAPNAVN